MLILTGRYLLPVSQPAIRDGALLIKGSRIRAVGPRTLLQKEHPGVARRDLGEAILLPGLVNVHTHLELSTLREQVHPGHSFVDWVLRLLERKQGLSWEAYATAVEEGIAELVQSGTTCVGDVSSIGASFVGLKRSGIRGVVYREIIGLDDARAEGISEMPFAHVGVMQHEAQGSPLDVGIAPHAVYSVSPKLFLLCRQFQQRARLKAAIHVAESPAEIEYLRSGMGEIRTRLLPATGWGELPPPMLGMTPVTYLHGLGVLGPECLLIHTVHLTEQDLDILATSGVKVAHCPRSNAHLGVGQAPLKALLDRKIPIGLGTDSLASNQSLSLWDEVRFAHRVHSSLLSPEEWITMATIGGAQALGLDREVGTLEPGKRADLTAVTLDGGETDPYEYLLHEAGSDKVRLTVVDGVSLYERQEV
ncbi:MAG: amidohydrolase family protein [Candidatus Methylomirabilales bacterium]